MNAEPAPTEKAQLHALAHGRVQGVYYRGFVEAHARRLGVAGWAHNLPDGRTVEIVAQGKRAALERLLEHLKRGPPGAHVATVDVEWGVPQQAFRTFEVR